MEDCTKQTQLRWTSFQNHWHLHWGRFVSVSDWRTIWYDSWQKPPLKQTTTVCVNGWLDAANSVGHVTIRAWKIMPPPSPRVSWICESPSRNSQNEYFLLYNFSETQVKTMTINMKLVPYTYPRQHQEYVELNKQVFSATENKAISK